MGFFDGFFDGAAKDFGVDVEQSDGSFFTKMFSFKEDAISFAEEADGYGHDATWFGPEE